MIFPKSSSLCALPLAVALLLTQVRHATADELTPSGSVDNSGPDTTVLHDNISVSYEEQSRMLTGVYPVSIGRMEQVIQHSYNWKGITDASMACEIGFTPTAMVLKGTILDDQPFVQPYAFPNKPDWWKTIYAADGLELVLEDPTSATNRLRLALNFSSAGLSPKVQIIEAPLVKTAGVLTSAELNIKNLTPDDIPEGITDLTTPISGFKFEAAIPTNGLAEPKFFSNGLRIRVSLHDLDGEIETYKKMGELIEKRD